MKKNNENNLALFVKITGELFFLMLFFFAIIFFKERTLFADASFFSFRMAEGESFDIELGRWGSVLSQLIPYLVIKCGGSLKLVLLSYSVSFIIWYYIFFELIIRWLKDYRAGLILILFLCLGFRQTFYYSTGELYMGTALVCFFWSFVSNCKWETDSLRKKWITVLVGIVLIYISSYFHQLLLFAISFLLLFEIIAYRRWKEVHLWLLLFVTVVWYYIRLKFLSVSGYESEKIPTLSSFIELLKRLRSLPGWKYYIQFSIHQMWSLWFALALACFLLIIKRKFIEVVFTLIFIFSFIALNITEYSQGTSSLFYENYYVLVGLYASVAIVFAFIYLVKPRKIIMAGLVLLICVNLKGLYEAHYRITERINYLKHLTDYGHKLRKQKLLIHTENLPVELCGDAWSLPFETLLISSINNPDSAVTFYHVSNMNSLDSLVNRENVFFGPKWAVTWFETINMNKRFYKLPSTGYEKLSTSQCEGNFKEDYYNKNNVSIIPVNNEYSSVNDTLLFIPVKINNSVSFPIASIPYNCEQVYLSYHINDKKGNLLIKDGLRTKLDVDIKGEYIQTLQVLNKFKKGEYIVSVDFVTEGKRWWNIDSKFKLIVN